MNGSLNKGRVFGKQRDGGKKEETIKGEKGGIKKRKREG